MREPSRPNTGAARVRSCQHRPPCRCARISPVSRCCSWSAAGAAVVYGRVQAGDDAREAAQADARFAARLAAREIGDGIKVLRQTVGGAAANPGVATAFAHPEDCGLHVRRHRRVHDRPPRPRPDQTARWRARRRRDRCDRGYAGADWLDRALREPLLLAPASDPRTGDQVVLATAPVPKLGFVLASFNLDARRREPAQELRRPARARVRARRRRGHDGADPLDRPDRWIGKPPTRRRADRDLDGNARLYASATVPGVELARARRRRPRRGAGRHPAAQPPRADDRPRRAAAVRPRDRGRAPARRAPARAHRGRDATRPPPRASRAC